MEKKEIIKIIDDIKSKKRGFTQSIELILSLKDIDIKKPENRINEMIEVPYPPKKDKKVAVFATGELAILAKNAGADAVYDKQDLERFASDKKNMKKIADEIDFFISEASLMSTVAKVLGSYLGPRGKLPTPIPPTAKIESIIERHRRTILIRVRNQPNCQCVVGTEDMPSTEIAENIETIITRLESKLEKGERNIHNVYLKMSMGTPIKLVI